MKYGLIFTYVALVWTYSSGQACRLAISRKFFLKKYEEDKPLLWCCTDKPNSYCQFRWQNSFLFWWQSSDPDCQEDTNVLSLLANILLYLVKTVLDIHDSLADALSEVLGFERTISLPEKLLTYSESTQTVDNTMKTVFSDVHKQILHSCTVMLDTPSRIAVWINKNWSSKTELTLLSLVVFCLFVTLFFSWLRKRMTESLMYDFFQEAKNVNIIVNDFETLKANQERMENLVEEINSFHNGAKRQIIKKQVALSILEQRLRVLRDVFREPLESYRSLCEMVTRGNMSTRELID